MKKIYLLFLALFISAANYSAQDKIEYFPGNLNVQPFTANFLEPKLGFLFKIDNNELRLDIGNSIDILHYKINENEIFSFGADLFTFTLLRREADFHFPVDAVDYLFGVNFTYKNISGKNEYGTRLRISHISAHFVDGHYDHQSDSWRNGLSPRVYSREFFELMPYYKISDLRVYLGLTYLFHVAPHNIGKDSYRFGFDYFMTDVMGKYFTPFIAYDFQLENIYTYTGNNSVSAGVKFGNVYGKGISLYLNYYSGKGLHGEYFDFNRNYSSLGINIDL